MSIDFDVLKGILSIDASKWDKGIAQATRSLVTMKAKTEAVFAAIDNASGRLASSLSKIAGATGQLDRISSTLSRSRDLVNALGGSLGNLQVPMLQASMSARRMASDMQEANSGLSQMRANTQQFAQPVVQQIVRVEAGIRGVSAAAGSAAPRINQMAAGLSQMQRGTSTIWGQMVSGAQNASLAFAGLATAAAGIGLSRLGSDIEENASLFKIVFAGAAGDAEKRLAAFADAVGRNKYELKGFASEFGALLNPMGLGSKATADMSVNLAKLTTDLSSFFNKAEPDVMIALRAALVGEMEPIRRLGVNLNQASLEAKALSMGLVKVGEDLTPAAKAQAAYALILEQTKQAQGDAARTSDGFANSSRNLGATVKQIGQEIDVSLLPAKTRFVQILDRIAENFLRKQVPAIQTWIKEHLSAERVSAVVERIGKRFDALSLVFGKVSSAISPLFGPARSLFDYLGQKFTEMPGWAQQLVLASSGLSAIGTALSISAPMIPIFGAFVGMIGRLISPLQMAGTAATSLGGAVQILSGAMRILWSSSLGPVGVAIAALAAALTYLYQSNEGFREWVDWAVEATKNWAMQMAEKLTPAFEVAWGVLKQGAEIVGDFVSNGLEKISGWWETVGQDVVLRNFEFLGESLGIVAGAVGTAAGAVYERLLPSFESVGSYIGESVWPLLQEVGAWLADTFGGLVSTAFDMVLAYAERVLQFWEGVFAALTDGGLRLKVFFADIATDIANILSTIFEKTAGLMEKIPGMSGVANSMRDAAAGMKMVGEAHQQAVKRQKEQIEMENVARRQRRQDAKEEAQTKEWLAKQDAAEAAKKKQAAKEQQIADRDAKSKPGKSPEGKPAGEKMGGMASIPPEERSSVVEYTGDPTAYGQQRDQASSTSFLRGSAEDVQGRFKGASRNSIQQMVGQFASESGDVAGRLAKYRSTEEGRKANIGGDVAELEKVRQQIIQTMQAAKNASGEARTQQVSALMELEAKYGATYDRISQKVQGTYKAETEEAKKAGETKANTAKSTADKEIAESDRRVQADKKGREQEVSNAKSAANEKQAVASQSASAGGSGASIVNGSVTYAGGRKLTNQGNGISLSAGGTGNGAPIYTDQVGSAMGTIMNMSMGLTNLFNGAVQGIGAGMASFNQALEEASPMQRIDMMIGNLQAKAGMMMHNTAVTGSMESRRAEVNVQEELDLLQRQKNKLWWDEADARSKAEDRARAAKNKPAAASMGGNPGSQAGQYGAMSVHDSGSTTVVQNFNGVTDHAEFAKQLEGALDRRGVSRSNSRNRFFSRSDSTFDKQGG